MEMHNVFELSRRATTALSIDYNLFKMGLTEDAIRLYVLLLQNVGKHTHAELSKELQLSDTSYQVNFKELKNASLIKAHNGVAVLSDKTNMRKIDKVVTLNVQSAYKKHLNAMA